MFNFAYNTFEDRYDETFLIHYACTGDGLMPG